MNELELLKFRVDTLENAMVAQSEQLTQLSELSVKLIRMVRNAYRLLELKIDNPNGVSREDIEKLQFDIMTQDLEGDFE